MDKAEMRRRYADGATMRQLAAAARCSLTTVQRNLADIARPAGRPRLTAKHDAVRRLVLDRGMSQNEAARRLGISRRQVSNALHTPTRSKP